MSDRTASIRERTAKHFSTVSPLYRALRDLDLQTVRQVACMLAELRTSLPIRVADIGAGTGRYTETVIDRTVREHGLSCHGVVYDASLQMLRAAPDAAPKPGNPLPRVQGLSETLPFRDSAFDAVLTFNAVHHFGLDAFLDDVARVLRPGGLLVIYTRTPQQNAQTIWGKLFPDFAKRETRLFSEETLRGAFTRQPEFQSVALRLAPWTLRTRVARVLSQTRGRCYSTFDFYSADEFAAALEIFHERLVGAYRSRHSIAASNDHLLVTARRR